MLEEFSVKLRKDNDRVMQLLQLMKRGSTDNRAGPWSKERHIWRAREHGEFHNLTMRTRFLEFHRAEQNEPVFCEDSLAPIPRLMAKDSQQDRRNMRVIKPLFTHEMLEEKKSYLVLEELLQDISGSQKESLKHSIEGSSYTDMQTQFIDIQKQISADVEEGRVAPSMNEMLQRLEDGKRIIDKIRERGGSDTEQQLREFIDHSLENRDEYSGYLKLVQKGISEIRNARSKYKEKLERSYMMLSIIHKATETCEVPDEIKVVAESKSERLTFEKAKKKKLRQRRMNPTPAQRVLEQLQSGMTDVKQSEELKDKVGMPARSFTLRELELKGVVVRVHDSIQQDLQRKMCFSFQYKDEGFNVQAFIKTTLLKEFRISREHMVYMQAGHKVNDMMFGGEDFLTLNCFRLQRLLAWIYAEGAL